MFQAQTPPPAPPPPPPAMQFVDATAELGVAGQSDARLALTDLNSDGRPDLVVGRRLVFLNMADPSLPRGWKFVQAPTTLPDMGKSAVTAFADFDNDGNTDAVVVRDADGPVEGEAAAVYCPGKGDGTFGTPMTIAALAPAHSAALAVGDVNGDGRLDLYRGNWYRKYGEALDAPSGDLLVQQGPEGPPASFVRVKWPEDGLTFDEEKDAAGRPTYGAVIARLSPPNAPCAPAQIAQLNYGRRWNRLYVHAPFEKDSPPEGWYDISTQVGFDGDADRSGAYPAWLEERAKTDKRFEREAEKPFRSNGNTFDMAVGDVNNDGMFDCFVAEITHAWAGPSADRSRFLIAGAANNALGATFTTPAWANVDRIPPGDGPESRSWNQGDLFCDLADLNNDGLVDLLLASGDYPDKPPFEQRLRIFRQLATPGPDGRKFVDATAGSGVDLPGAGQLAIGDLDLDGDVDIVCGQSFTRFTEEMKKAAGGTPQLHVYLNQASQNGARGTTLTLRGEKGKPVSRDAIGAVVVVVNTDGRMQIGQLLGTGGHSGKQNAAQIHFGNTTPQARLSFPPGVIPTQIINTYAPAKP